VTDAGTPGISDPGALLVEEAHRAAVELCSELDLVTLDDRPVLLQGDAMPRGRRVLPRHRLPLLLPLLHECGAAGVRIVERAVVIGLATAGDRLTGVTTFLRESGRPTSLAADAVVLACGGVGSVFPMTTVPRWCRGSAIALASACGVSLHAPHLTQALPVTATPPLYFPTTAALLAGRIVVDGRLFAGGTDLVTATSVMAEASAAGRASPWTRRSRGYYCLEGAEARRPARPGAANAGASPRRGRGRGRRGATSMRGCTPRPAGSVRGAPDDEPAPEARIFGQQAAAASPRTTTAWVAGRWPSTSLPARPGPAPSRADRRVDRAAHRDRPTGDS
jgi:hypothetical protein